MGAGPDFDFDHQDLERLRRRRGEKWRLFGEGPEAPLAAWVAEMDFPLAPPVRAVLERALELDDVGYPLPPARTGLPEETARRMRERFGWEVSPDQVEVITDVVQGLYVALETLSQPGEGAVVQTPIYPPFLAAVAETGRRLDENPLRLTEGGYAPDIEGLRRVGGSDTRLLLLCHPHNPSGRVFRREELQAIAEVVLERDLVVVSDEIHADLVYPGHRHIPFATLSPEIASRTVTLTSATKAFNIPGLRCAVAIFGRDSLKERFLRVPRSLRGGIGLLGIEATLAAWREGQPWLDAALRYLDGNRRHIAEFVAAEMPGVGYVPPEAAILAWLDFRRLDLRPTPRAFFLERAGVALGEGLDFGEPGRGFARITFATSRRLLDEILGRMARALRARR